MNIGNCNRKYQVQIVSPCALTTSTRERLPESITTPRRLRINGTS
jgi:hypothetical protein